MSDLNLLSEGDLEKVEEYYSGNPHLTIINDEGELVSAATGEKVGSEAHEEKLETGEVNFAVETATEQRAMEPITTTPTVENIAAMEDIPPIGDPTFYTAEGKAFDPDTDENLSDLNPDNFREGDYEKVKEHYRENPDLTVINDEGERVSPVTGEPIDSIEHKEQLEAGIVNYAVETATEQRAMEQRAAEKAEAERVMQEQIRAAEAQAAAIKAEEDRQQRVRDAEEAEAQRAAEAAAIKAEEDRQQRERDAADAAAQRAAEEAAIEEFINIPLPADTGGGWEPGGGAPQAAPAPTPASTTSPGHPSQQGDGGDQPAAAPDFSGYDAGGYDPAPAPAPSPPSTGGPPSQSGNGGGGGNGCFLPDTPITMADGSTKPVKDVDLGDEVAEGGKVFAAGRFLIDNLYDYKGIKVSGSHMVNEDDKWTRIENSKHGKSLGDNEHTVYVFGAENRRILIKGILFTDYFELPEQEQLDKNGDKWSNQWREYTQKIEKQNVAILNAS